MTKLEERVEAIAAFLAKQCPLCHGQGRFHAATDRQGNVVFKDCWQCQGLRDKPLGSP